MFLSLLWLKARKEKINREKKNQYYTKDEFILIAGKEKKSFLTESKPSQESKLSIYLKSKLTEKDLKKIDYNSIQNSTRFKLNPLNYKTYDHTIRLSFEITKKNKYKNVRVSTGNYELNKKIKDVFRAYPIDRLNLNEKSKLGKNICLLYTSPSPRD